MLNDDRGSTIAESVSTILLVLLLLLGTIEISLALYARNVVIAAVQEGVRSAAEVGASAASGPGVVKDVIARSAGGLTREVDVNLTRHRFGDTLTFRAVVHAVIVAPGIARIPFNVRAVALADRPVP